MTTTKTTTTRTQARKAEAEALHHTLTAQVEALANSHEWARFVKFAGSFHHYSLNNVLFILTQNPHATHVAGYTQWKQLGRHVKKGEHGIRIFATATRHPHTTQTPDNHEPDDDLEEDTAPVRYYPIVSVFDINQTEPIAGTAPLPEPVHHLTGADDHGITAPLTDYLTQHGWNVTTEPLHGTQSGYTDPATRRVVIRAHVSPAQHAKTLLHETAHILLDHTNTPTEYVLHRGRMETEAESVTYITGTLAGLDTSKYSIGYITGWANGDTKLLKDTATHVLTTVRHLTTILGTP